MNPEKVFGYIDSLQQNKDNEIQDSNFKNSMEYKHKCLDKAKADATKQCLSRVFEKFYLQSIPLNEEYKTAYLADLCDDIPGFIKKRDCEDIAYYVGEAQKRGCKSACRIMESVQKLVDESFEDKEMNLKDYQANDLVFRMDDATDKKIDVITQDLELDDLAQVISDNVKTTAASEIMRAKKEKENAKALETELANDMSITNESAIEDALAIRGLNQKSFFQPSLFEGIMIGKLNSASIMKESGALDSVFLYDALEDYGFVKESGDTEFATPEEIAFVESVREYTLLNMEKALKFRKYNLTELRDMATEYAMG